MKDLLDKFKKSLETKEENLLKEVQKRSQKIKKKHREKNTQKKASKDIDYDYIILFALFVISLFIYKLLNKKKSIREEELSPEIRNDIKADLRSLPKVFSHFTEEVICHYRFYHKTINKIYYPELHAPPVMRVSNTFDDSQELSLQADILGEVFNQIQYEDKTDFSIKERNLFRDHFKKFIKRLKL